MDGRRWAFAVDGRRTRDGLRRIIEISRQTAILCGGFGSPPHSIGGLGLGPHSVRGPVLQAPGICNLTTNPICYASTKNFSTREIERTRAVVLFDIKMSIFGAELVCVTGGYEVRSMDHVTIRLFVPSGTLAFEEISLYAMALRTTHIGIHTLAFSQ